MTNHGDGATPLWLTEFGWGSAPPDRFGINKGLAGQAQMLSVSFRMILSNRSAWNLQRLFWFLWRDPPPDSVYATPVQLLRQRGAADGTTAPRSPPTPRSGASRPRRPAPGEHHRGAEPGRLHQQLDPELLVRLERARLDLRLPGRRGPFKPCGSPYTAAALSDGAHTFFVRAIDAPGNESPIVSRSFTVDTVAPAVRISSGPAAGRDLVQSESLVRLHLQRLRRQASAASSTAAALHACSSPFTASGLADGSHTSRSGQRIEPRTPASSHAPGPSTPPLRR